jgi:hypothetical protein
LLVGALLTVVVNAVNVVDTWIGPTGDHLTWISTVVGLPSSLCVLAVVLLCLRSGGEKTRRAARGLAAASGVVLAGLAATGIVGVVLLALPRHGKPAILRTLDASSDAVGYVTTLGVAGTLLVLGLARSRETA